MFKSPAIHRTPLYRAKSAYNGMLRRCGDPFGKNPSYANVELRMSLKEWLVWAIPRYKKFIEKNPGISPNASRKGDKGHYEIGNVRIVSKAENRSEQAKTKATHPDGTKICTTCKRTKQLKAFGKRTSALDGLQSRCRRCIANASIT